MRVPRLGSIRGKLVAAFLGAIVPLIVVNLVGNVQNSRERLKLFDTSKDQVAAAVAGAVDLYLLSIKRSTAAVAQGIKHGWRWEIARSLEEMQEAVPYLQSASVVDADSGRILASSSPWATAAAIPPSSVIAEESETGGFRVSNLIIRKGAPHIFALNSSIRLPGGRRGIIHCEIAAASIGAPVRHALAPGVMVIVSDRAGRVIYASPSLDLPPGASVPPQIGARGGNYSRGDARLGVCGWRVTVFADAAALRASDRSARLRLVLSICISALGLLFVVWYANRTAGWIHKLARGASALAVGDLGRRFNVKSGDELEGLATALNSMAENIEARERDIAQLSSRLEGLFGIARAVASSLDLGEILRSLARATAEVLSAKACAIYLLEPDGHLVIKEAYNLSSDFISNVRLEVGERWTGVAVANRHWITASGLRDDPEFRYRGELQKEGLDSLLSAPLIAGSAVLGAITVWTGESRQFSPMDIYVLTSIADHAASVIQNARLYDREARIAETLQSALIGSIPTRIGSLEFATKYMPALEEARIGGDFMDAFKLPDGRVAVLIADVMGQGLKAAIHTAMLKFILRAYLLEDPDDPGRALERLNWVINQGDYAQLFVTLLLAVLDSDKERMAFANAGHPPAIMVDPDGKLQVLLYKTGLPLGCAAETTYATRVVDFPAGSRILLYTDGIMEARSGNEIFGLKRLEAALFECRELAPQRMVDTVCARASEFAGGHIEDDIAIMAIALAPKEIIVSDGARPGIAGTIPAHIVSLKLGNQAKLLVEGECDFQAAERFSQALEKAIRAAKKEVVVDMSGVTLVDSSIMAALVSAERQARRQGIALRLESVSPDVEKVMRICGLEGTLCSEARADSVSVEKVGAAMWQPREHPESRAALDLRMHNIDWHITEAVAICEPDVIARLRGIVRSTAKECGLSGRDAAEICLAAGEAIARAAASAPSPERTISLRCLACQSAFVVEVVDESGGPIFAEQTQESLAPAGSPQGIETAGKLPEDMPQFEDHAAVEPMDDPRLMGLRLMREAVDEMDAGPSPEGYRIRLVKWIQPIQQTIEWD